MITFPRSIEPHIRELLFRGRIVIIFGPRQVGKTTLAKKLIAEYGEEGGYFNCEELGVRQHFSVGEPEKLKSLIGNKKIVVFDEAQTIQNIGAILKVFIDRKPDVQIIATGSSSFDLANKINEPLTGRSFEFLLYPLSRKEIRESGMSLTSDELNRLLLLGSYPAVVGEENAAARKKILKNITTNYLFKDVFVFESIRNPRVFEDLIKLLAYQIGSLVSVNELSRELGVSRRMIDTYLRLLEQTYIIRKVHSFSKNKRNEIKKAFKVYFLDTGIRNVVADLLDPLVEIRQDKGALLENFFFTEKLKEYALETFPPQIAFWRTTQKQEIDFVEQKGTSITAYECKWKKVQVSFNAFLHRYPEAHTRVVTFEDFLKTDV